MVLAYIQRQAPIGIFVQDQKSDGRARKATNGLKAECRKHHAPANAARNTLGDDQMRGRIVASERKADADEGHDHDQKRRAEGEDQDEDGEQHHLDDEHLLAAVSVGQAAQRRGADQDTEQGGGGDDALLGRPQREFLPHQGQGHAGREDDHALEELAGRGEPPDEPLHVGHRGIAHGGRIRPHRRFVDVLLDGSGHGGAASGRRILHGHDSQPYDFIK
jgi:hypothetical protein